MVEKVNEVVFDKFKKGDLLEVKSKEGNFTCIVVEDLGGGFIGRVLSKDAAVGTASWGRYSLKDNARLQATNECYSIKKIASAQVSEATSTLELNESVQKSSITYYKTPLDEERYITFCESEGYGGWSIHSASTDKDALKEAFLGSQISKINTTNRNSKLS